MPRDTADKLAIRDIDRKLGDLARRAACGTASAPFGTSDGHMWATWFQGTYEEFIKVSQEGYDRGVRIMHMLGGTTHRHQGQARDRADPDGDPAAGAGRGRAVRRDLHGTLLRLPGKTQRQMGHRAAPARLREGPHRSGRAGRRCPRLTRSYWRTFPEGYRHLAYLQSKIGYRIKDELPGLDGAPLAALYAKGENWLKGKKL